MKVICTQENLKFGLLTVGRIISSNNTLPILNNILLKTENGLLNISSTNLEVAITTHIRCKIEEEGETTVLAKTITELVNNLPNKNITLETQNNELKIEAENYHTNIKTLSSEEFPLIPNIEKQNSLNLNSQELKTAADQVVYAASKNQTQPELSGVLFRVEGKIIKIVATDRYRLAEKTFNINQENTTTHDLIVPSKTILELSRIIGNNKGKIEMVINETQISFEIEGTRIISRLVEGQYPDYQQIIPASFLTTITTKKQALVNALRASGIFSQNSNSIRLEYNLDEQKLTLSSESQELGKSVVDLESKIEGGSGLILLNNHYMLDCLANIDAEEVLIKIVDDSSPSLITPKGRNDYIYLVMPIKA